MYMNKDNLDTIYLNNEYKEKYLRYKKKYFELKEDLEGGGLDGSDIYEIDCKISLVKNENGGNFSLDKIGIKSKDMTEDPNKVRKFFITYGKTANIFKIASTTPKMIGSGLKRNSALQIRTGVMNIVSGQYESITKFDNDGIVLTVGGQIFGGDDIKIKLLTDGLVAKKLDTPESKLIFGVCSAKKGLLIFQKKCVIYFQYYLEKKFLILYLNLLK